MGDKDAYWFYHDSNAFQDPKIARLFRLHGLEGYGLFWVAIERLREAGNHRIKCDSIPDLVYQMRSSECIFNALFDCELLHKTEDGFFFSHSLDRRMEEWHTKKEARRAAGRKGGKQKSSNAKAMLKQIHSKPIAKPKQNVPSRVENRREDEIRENETEEEKKSLHPDACRLTGLLIEAIKKWRPDALIPKSTASWESDIDRMLRLDKRKPENIEAVLKWLPTYGFWAKNIKSASKLREKFETLEDDMNPQPTRQAEAAKPKEVRLDGGEDPKLRPRPDYMNFVPEVKNG
jgi:hypothetical protein